MLKEINKEKKKICIKMILDFTNVRNAMHQQILNMVAVTLAKESNNSKKKWKSEKKREGMYGGGIIQKQNTKCSAQSRPTSKIFASDWVRQRNLWRGPAYMVHGMPVRETDLVGAGWGRLVWKSENMDQVTPRWEKGQCNQREREIKTEDYTMCVE